jgi:hypothetical protein
MMKCAPATESAKDPGQITFSTIGDVHLALSAAVHGGGADDRRTPWTALAVYPLLAYVVGFAALLYLDTPPPGSALLWTPLAPALVCLLAAWSRARWKRRSQAARTVLQAAGKVLDSLSHETASGLNAIRAHMIGLRMASPNCAASAHFSSMGLGADRIGAALARAQGSHAR